MKRVNPIQLLSNIIIVISLFIFVILFYPLVQAYLFPPQLSAQEIKEDYAIVIPSIHASGLIQQNVDPWNESEYKPVLKQRIAHAKGSALPGEQGTQFLFAHSSGPFWEQTKYNSVFLRLNELKRGDSIEIFYKGKNYRYVVREKKEVSPDQVSVLTQTKQTQLIIQTCTPIGTDWNRLLVFADPL